ncbi:MAG: J domain-containing protein [Polyangiaceae bacterium]|nr:J domain-containing protein [Polyangiaceae bacterium]
MDEEQKQRLMAWMALVDECDYYELLGVPPTADHDTIKNAYRGWVGSFHPDAHPADDASTLDLLTRVFQRGTEAYRVLTDVDLRTRYDIGLRQGELRLRELLTSAPAPRQSSSGKPLHELCRSAGAKLAAKQADSLLAKGDLAGAKRQLELALSYDGGANLDLAERLEALETALYVSGG